MEEIKNEWYKDHSNDDKGNFFDKIKYLRTRKYFKEKIVKLLKLNINSIIIICGAHHKYKKYTNSSMYIDMIIDLFKEYGIDCKLSFKNNPDKDLFVKGFNGLFLINCQSSSLIPNKNKFGSNEGEEYIAIISPV